jgi:hypothetical protein
MTNEEYAAWRRGNRTGNDAAALAASITLKDEDT